MSLDQLDPELGNLLRGLTAEQLQSFARNATTFAIESAGLVDEPVLSKALFGSGSQDEVTRRASELDEQYFSVGERREQGEATDAEYLAAFAKARAAEAARLLLVGGEPLEVAGDIAYEVQSANETNGSVFLAIARDS